MLETSYATREGHLMENGDQVRERFVSSNWSRPMPRTSTRDSLLAAECEASGRDRRPGEKAVLKNEERK